VTTTSVTTTRAPDVAAAQQTADPAVEAHLAALRVAVDGFDPQARTAATWGRRLAAVLPAGGRLFAAGNGGSAAQAQHLTAELVGRYRDERPPMSAVCLTAETSSLTAIVNDYPPHELYARQVQAHARPGDVLVLLSTSGRSLNVLAAARRARTCGTLVLAFTGRLPNPLADLADEVVSVDADDTATVQELHLVALHVLCEALDDELAGREQEAAR
jgi:D-sedoheptulose 7-phosphate isomerase